MTKRTGFKVTHSIAQSYITALAEWNISVGYGDNFVQSEFPTFYL